MREVVPACLAFYPKGTPDMMDLFSIPHLLIVLLVVMVLFGTNRLPEIGAGLGKAIRNFKQASSELDEVDATFKKDEKDITK